MLVFFGKEMDFECVICFYWFGVKKMAVSNILIINDMWILLRIFIKVDVNYICCILYTCLSL